MRKLIFSILLGGLVASCQTERPDMIFQKTVINTNLIAEFGSEILETSLPDTNNKDVLAYMPPPSYEQIGRAERNSQNISFPDFGQC